MTEVSLARKTHAELFAREVKLNYSPELIDIDSWDCNELTVVELEKLSVEKTMISFERIRNNL